MAFIGSFEALKDFINKNTEHPMVKFLFERSGVKPQDVQTYEDFLKITPFSKRELSLVQDGTVPYSSLIHHASVTKIFQSPGPLVNVKGAEFHHYRFYKALETAGFDITDTVLNTFSYHISPAGEMFDEALRYLGCPVVPSGPVESGKAAELVMMSFATGFIGTKTFLLKVLRQLGENNSINKAYLIAEKVTSDDVKMFKDDFGVDVYQGYGTAEVGLIASECSVKDGWHVDIESLFVEIIDPHTGEPADEGVQGEVVVSFMNETTPFIRLALGDISNTMTGICPCGDDTGRLEGLFGRVDMSVKVKGCFVHFWQVESFFSELGVKGRLVVEAADGADRLKIETDKEVTDIKEKFKKQFGLTVTEAQTADVGETEVVDNRENYKQK